MKSQSFFLKGLNFILIILTYIISYIVPKKKGLYVFGSADGISFSGNSKEVFSFYLKKKECYYISHNKKLKSIIGSKYFAYALSCKSYWKLLRAEFLFLDSSIKHISFLYALIGRFSIILLWHGDGFKKIEFENPYFREKQGRLGVCILKKQYKNIKLGITGNFFNKNTFNHSFGVDTFNVIGLPRNNVFIEKREKNYLIGGIDTKHYKKIILYTPTWRDSKVNKNLQPFTSKFYKEFQDFLEENNFLFIYKPHPISKISYISTKNIKILEKNLDIQEVMNIVDILITDYSSIYIDFLLTDKPILFYTYDYNEFINKDKDLYFGYEDIIIKGGNFDTEKLIIEYIYKIDEISNTIEYKQNYLRLKKFFHQYDKNNILQNLDREIKKIR